MVKKLLQQRRRTGDIAACWADPALDCEYTYYGLLSLGHLSGRRATNSSAGAQAPMSL